MKHRDQLKPELLSPWPLCCYDQIPDKGQVSGEALFFDHGLRGHSSSQPEDEVTGHTVSTVKKQRETTAPAQLCFSFFFCVGPQPRGSCLPLRVGLPCSFKPF